MDGCSFVRSHVSMPKGRVHEAEIEERPSFHPDPAKHARLALLLLRQAREGLPERSGPLLLPVQGKEKPLMDVSNGPACCMKGAHSGKIHQYTARKFAETDGTPVKNAPVQVAFICEEHYPDRTDPTFALCRCELCLKRMGIK